MKAHHHLTWNSPFCIKLPSPTTTSATLKKFASKLSLTYQRLCQPPQGYHLQVSCFAQETALQAMGTPATGATIPTKTISRQRKRSKLLKTNRMRKMNGSALTSKSAGSRMWGAEIIPPWTWNGKDTELKSFQLYTLHSPDQDHSWTGQES